MFRSKRRVGVLAALVLVLSILVGNPQVNAQDDPPPAGETAAEQAGDGDFTVTYSAEAHASRSAGDTRATNPVSDMDFVGLPTGCRIFDTRKAQGPLIVNVGRDYSVAAAKMASQGGKAGGCGIPDSAVAVDMSLSTLANSPTGTGFVRLGRAGAAPTATVLQFLKNQGTSVTTTSPLNGMAVRVQAFNANAGMTGDILGYWQEPMHATVTEHGQLLRGKGVAEVRKSTVYSGSYIIEFERNVSACTPVATVETSFQDAVLVGTSLNSPTLVPHEVFVRAMDLNADSIDREFSLVVEC